MGRDLQLSGTEIVARNGALLTAEVDGELLAMNVDRGYCYGLDPIGTRIWSLIEQPCSIEGICDVLLDEYQVDEATCRRDVIALLCELRREGIVAIRPRDL